MQQFINCIEITSRFAYSFPLKSKADAPQKLIDFINNNTVRCIYADQGKEFVNNTVTTFCEEKNIKLILADAGDKHLTSIVERFNGSIRKLILRFMEAHGTHKWIDKIDDLIYNYNHTYHDTIKMTPAECMENKQKFYDVMVRMVAKKFIMKQKLKLKSDDFVRIAEKHEKFQKTKRNWSNEIYKIIGRSGNGYKLQDKDGNQLERNYKIYELLKIPVQSFEGNNSNFELEKKEKEIVKKRKIIRKIRKEGIDTTNIIESKRNKNTSIGLHEELPDYD